VIWLWAEFRGQEYWSETRKNLWDRDEELETIPYASLDEEGLRRDENFQLKKYYEVECKERSNQGLPLPQKPKYKTRRIWWDNKWHKKVYLPSKDLKHWKMLHLSGQKLMQAQERQPCSVFGVAGNKHLPAGSVYLRRTESEGLALYSGSQGLEKGVIVTLYGGSFKSQDILLKHKSKGDRSLDHYLALRRWATVPCFATIIDSGVNHVPVGAYSKNKYNLEYYVQNHTAGGMLNARERHDSNCSLDTEYRNYPMFSGNLYLDDQYCPPNTPYDQLVC
jgi:hypothetical protein